MFLVAIKSLILSRRGFGMIEALGAAAIVGVAALGLGASINHMGKTTSKVQMVMYALAIESELQAHLQDKSTYASISAELANGSANLNSLPLSLKVPMGNTLKVLNINLSNDIYFGADNNICTTCSSGANWNFKLRIEGKKISTTGVPVYALAYRLDFNPTVHAIAGIGAVTTPAGFQASDFKWVVPLGAYIMTSSLCINKGNDHLLVTGIDKSNGDLLCAQIPSTTKCANDEVAKGWIVKPGNPIQIVLDCQKMKVSTTCPVLAPGGFNYVVQSINKVPGKTFIDLDDPHGTCVFIAEGVRAVSLGSISAGSAVYAGCPANYHWVGTGTNNGCNINSSSKIYGWRNICNHATSTGDTWVQDVAPASALSINGTLTGNGVTCSLVGDGPGSSGEGWTASISAVGNCVLNDTDTKTF